MKKIKARAYRKQPYARIITPDEQGGFYAEVLEFPGCFADGETPTEAYANLERAAESWIEAVRDQGNAIPEPSSNIGYSGKIALRLPKSMHRQAVRLAERNGTSLNQFLVSAIAARIGAEELYSRLVQRFEDRMMASTSVRFGKPAASGEGKPQRRGGEEFRSQKPEVRVIRAATRSTSSGQAAGERARRQ